VEGMEGMAAGGAARAAAAYSMVLPAWNAAKMVFAVATTACSLRVAAEGRG
jgi:hypothetical protein